MRMRITTPPLPTRLVNLGLLRRREDITPSPPQRVMTLLGRRQGKRAAPIVVAVTSAPTSTYRGGRGNTIGSAGEIHTEVAENGGG